MHKSTTKAVATIKPPKKPTTQRDVSESEGVVVAVPLEHCRKRK